MNGCITQTENMSEITGNLFQSSMPEFLGSDSVNERMRMLAEKYAFVRLSVFGKSVMGKPLLYICAGNGQRRIFFSACHHANEWITTPVLLKFMSELFEKAYTGGRIGIYNAGDLLSRSTVYFAPLINPDGEDLVLGIISNGQHYNDAKKIAEDYPLIPFPSGWKANIEGTDLNLQYPAGWEKAKQIKFNQGFICPAPRDFVGSAPLSAPESLALYDLTKAISPDVIIAMHAQGKEIYWKFGGCEPEGAHSLGLILSEKSGYKLSETPPLSDNAGFKDWFIEEYNRPGYTVELGDGENPLPLDQFDEIYSDVAPMFSAAIYGS